MREIREIVEDNATETREMSSLSLYLLVYALNVSLHSK
jgi:hypothetical protein